ncbi:MAG: amidohydrolase [Planctomycetes bacterium]|nr:amidohydrolase [Planctomycetota bacterium]
MQVADSHAHFFGYSFYRALAEESPLEGTVAEKLARVARTRGLELPDPDPLAHWKRWEAELEDKGVDHLVTFASLPSEYEDVARVIEAADGRVSGVAVANPKAPGCAQKIAALLDERGYRGVLLFPAQHGYRIDGPECAELLAVLAARRAPCYASCGLLTVPLRDFLGLPRTQDIQLANPLHLIPASNAHPDVPFIVPHFGAGFLRETLMAGLQCENVHVDTSSSNSWMRVLLPQVRLADVLERALDVFGPGRILFGTDSGTFPTGWRIDRFDEQKTAFAACGVREADLQQIMAGNTLRLFGHA